jgi:hypothetical protein
VVLHESSGRVSDSVKFGVQALGFSFGESAGVWTLLSTPTPGLENAPAATQGDLGQLKINEWMAAPLAGDDWIELHNAQDAPVQIGGMVLTDDPSVHGRTNRPLERLSFIAPRGFALLQADGETDRGPDHLGFRLDAFGETVRLYSGLIMLDEVVILPQLAGASEGRSPDASTNIVQFPALATPGASNPVLGADRDGDGMPDEWESAHGLDPASAADALSDRDGDGASALDEFRAGTDPRDRASVLGLSALHGPAGVELRFMAGQGRSYSILGTERLDMPAWIRVANVEAGPQRAVDLPTPAAIQARFYRLVTPMLP